jgi:hypothetical protein
MNTDIKTNSSVAKTYCIDITSGNFYQLEITAETSEDALAQAQAMLEGGEFEAVACAQPYITEWNCEPA